MVGGVAAAVTAFFTVVAMILEIFTQQMQIRKEASDETNIQPMRQALQAGDSNQIDADLADQHDRIDRLLGPEAGSGTGRQAGNGDC